MKQFGIFLFLFMILSSLNSLSGKGKNEFLVDIGAGFGSGWWVYNKGSLNGSAAGNYGWDHTAAKPNVNFESNLIYKRNHFKIGGNFNYILFKATEMLRHDDAIGAYHRYKISDKFVEIIKLGLLAEYDIFSGARYALAPYLSAGTFFINTSHPEKDNFGFKLYVAVGLNNNILLKNRFSFFIRPTFNVMTIWPQDRKAIGERHHIYSLGINIGTRIKLL